MARPVQARKSYQADVAHLSRLSLAIDKDPRLVNNVIWRQMIKRKISDLMVLLLNLDQRRKASDG